MSIPSPLPVSIPAFRRLAARLRTHDATNELYDRVCLEGGLVEPEDGSFPRRNRVARGLEESPAPTKASEACWKLISGIKPAVERYIAKHPDQFRA